MSRGTDSPLGFAIIGTGMIARYHAQAIAETPGARLVTLCASGPEQAAAAAARFGVPCDSDLNAVLQRPDVDAVCICTPSGLHAQQAIAAARAGKHVLVEKPIALSLADADAMIAAAREAGVLLAVALQRRTDPDFIAVRQAIAAGELGRMVLGTISVPYVRPQSYYDSAAWRGTWALDGGGALMNQGVHLVDLLLWYMGEVEEVFARFDTLAHEIEVEDCLAATLRFANGALGSIVATTAAAPGFPHRVEVYGTQGGVQIEGEAVVRWDQAGEGGAAESRRPATAATPQAAGAGASPTGISAVGHTRLVTDLVEAVRTGRAPLVPGEEGRRSLATVLAVYESARTGRPARPG
ncbi:MAG: Gfo/Idh/MocA family oxidoreductase [Chloroflexota bacterium]|nr:MAG: gfo/Idh/MocA family oxidoreductase [Chloroflexota bacterium]